MGLEEYSNLIEAHYLDGFLSAIVSFDADELLAFLEVSRSAELSEEEIEKAINRYSELVEEELATHNSCCQQ